MVYGKKRFKVQSSSIKMAPSAASSTIMTSLSVPLEILGMVILAFFVSMDSSPKASLALLLLLVAPLPLGRPFCGGAVPFVPLVLVSASGFFFLGIGDEGASGSSAISRSRLLIGFSSSVVLRIIS
jgi:hypothetical protein